MTDILIRGMEMPKHCFNCSTKIGPDNRRCNIDGHVFEETLSKLTCRRDEHCPLVELPEHGDLIDASKLIPIYEEMKWSDDYCKECMKGAIWEVEQAPVIIPASKEESE